jgi:hypothetical protein
MRTFVSMLICLALVFQSATHARALQPPCPMEQSGHDADLSLTAGASQGDCCNDEDTVAKTGKLCKTGAECQSTSVCLLVGYFSPSLVVDTSAPPHFVARLDPLDSPHSVWRPPALA